MTALRAFVTIGLAGLWLLICVPPMFQTAPTIYSGVHPVLTGALVQPNIVRVDRGSPAYRAGLRTGDVLGCLSLRDNALLLSEAYGGQQAYRAGTVLSTCVQRNGKSHRVRFAAQTGPLLANAYGSNALAAVRVCVFVVFLLTGIALVMARPSLMTWIFYAFCLGTAPIYAAGEIWSTLPAWQYAIAVGIPTSLALAAVALLLLFAALVPNELVPSGWRRWAFYGALALALADFGFVVTTVFYTDVIVTATLQNIVGDALTAVTVLVVLARLATMERSERARFGWAAFAIIFGVVADNLDTILSNNASPYALSVSVLAGDLSVVMPIALTYAILKRHVIDVRFVISRTVVYATVTTIVVALIGAVDWVTSTYLHQARVAMALDALVTIGLGLALHRAYGWVEHAVDFLLYHHKHEAETYLQRLARTLPFAEHEDAIDRALVHDPYEKLELFAAALFRTNDSAYRVVHCDGWNPADMRAFSSDDDLVRFLLAERSRVFIADLRKHIVEGFREHGVAPAVGIPVFQGNRLTAFAIYAIHRDGTKLDPDEIETLEHLCNSAAQAYTGLELARYQRLPQALTMEAL